MSTRITCMLFQLKLLAIYHHFSNRLLGHVIHHHSLMPYTDMKLDKAVLYMVGYLQSLAILSSLDLHSLDKF